MRKPKVYLNIMGNCGNQFFQYAFARNLQERLGADLIIDYSAVINDTTFAMSGSDNLLADYNTAPYTYTDGSGSELKGKRRVIKLLNKMVEVLKLQPYTQKKYKFVLWCAKHLEKYGIYYFTAPYYPYKYDYKGDVVVYGYFECTKYFADIDHLIKKELTPKAPLLESNKDLYETITNRESVCITIKRCDIENSDISDIYAYDINYFYHAVDYIKSRVDNPVFVIFSDNVDWCRENFHIDAETLYETPGNPIWEKIRLMSGCKHFIIHNSTFSWWVQHLSTNDDKIVVAPTRWMNSEQPIDLYEDNWIYMTNDGEVRTNHD